MSVFDKIRSAAFGAEKSTESMLESVPTERLIEITAAREESAVRSELENARPYFTRLMNAKIATPDFHDGVVTEELELPVPTSIAKSFNEYAFSKIQGDTLEDALQSIQASLKSIISEHSDPTEPVQLAAGDLYIISTVLDDRTWAPDEFSVSQPSADATQEALVSA